MTFQQGALKGSWQLLRDQIQKSTPKLGWNLEEPLMYAMHTNCKEKSVLTKHKHIFWQISQKR